MTPFSHTVLITADKKPTPALLALLSLCDIHHDGSLTTIIEATQKEQPVGFLRPKDKERWQITSYVTAKADAIRHQCDLLAMLQEIKPLHHQYDYIVVFGGSIHGIRMRLAFLKKLWEEGVRSQKIIILTGQRFLDPAIESEAILTDKNNGLLPITSTWSMKDYPKTETDMIRMVLEQSIVPQDWHSIPIIYIDTPAPLGSMRPNTGDTIQYWLTTQPIPGSLLAISEQPLIGYQDAVLRRFLPKSFIIETVGSAIVPDTKPELLIGTVGWWLYNAYLIS